MPLSRAALVSLAALVTFSTPAYADPVGALTDQAQVGAEALTGGPDPALVAAYETSWTHRALQLQEDLGAGLPMSEMHVVSSHNSFNTVGSPLPGVAELSEKQ